MVFPQTSILIIDCESIQVEDYFPFGGNHRGNFCLIHRKIFTDSIRIFIDPESHAARRLWMILLDNYFISRYLSDKLF